MRRLGIIIVTLLTGCAGGDRNPESGLHEITATFDRDYQQLAGCTYLRIDKVLTRGIHKTDLPTESQIKIVHDSGAMRYWELIFTSTGPTRTSVYLSMPSTMWGFPVIPRTYRMIQETLKACAAQ